MIDDRSTPAQIEAAYWSAQGHVSALSAELADVKTVLNSKFPFLRDPVTAVWVSNVIDYLDG